MQARGHGALITPVGRCCPSYAQGVLWARHRCPQSEPIVESLSYLPTGCSIFPAICSSCGLHLARVGPPQTTYTHSDKKLHGTRVRGVSIHQYSQAVFAVLRGRRESEKCDLHLCQPGWPDHDSDNPKACSPHLSRLPTSFQLFSGLPLSHSNRLKRSESLTPPPPGKNFGLLFRGNSSLGTAFLKQP